MRHLIQNSRDERLSAFGRYRIAARLAAVVCILIGGLTLAGWALDVAALKDLFRVGITMKANAALAMALAGAAIWLLLPQGTNIARRGLGYVLAAGVTIIGALTLSEHLMSWNLGIDELLTSEPPGQTATMSPGRMGPPASTCYTLAGVALLMSGRGRRAQILAQGFALAVGLIALLGILGSLYGAEPLYAVARYTGISLQTSLGLLLLGAGLLCSWPDRGIMRVFSSSDIGGVLMRRLLLPLVGLTIFLASLRLLGEAENWYDRGFGVSAFVLIMIVMLTGLVAWTAVALNRISAQRAKAERDLQQQNEHLQILYRLSDAVSRAVTVDEICRLALDELMAALRADRASVLLFESDGVMRFKAWRGLSDSYRRAVEGHSPWKADARDPQPITIGDVGQSEPLRPLRDTIIGEGIYALAFIPLVDDQRLLGKFMVYFDQPHAFTANELAVARAVAAGVAFSINRAVAAGALRDSVQRTDAILKSALDAIVTMDLAGNVVEFNHAAERIFGYSRSEVIGKPLADLIVPPHLREAHRRGLARYRDTGEGQVLEQLIEMPAMRSDGSEFSAELAIVPIPAAGLFTAFVRDITARKSTQEALADSEKRLRLALRAGRSGAWDWDIINNRVTWSDYLYELHGLAREEFAGTVEAFSKLVHPDDLHEVRQRIQAAMEAREPYELEFRILRPDGTIVWISTSAMVLRDERGKPLRMIGVTSDITARKRAEHELQMHSHNLESLVAERTMELERTHERMRLSERMAALGTLAAGLGHDMGNLLLPVRVRLQALQGTPLADEAIEHLTVVNTCIGYLQNLAKGLRLFALDPNVVDASETTNLHDWRAQVQSFFRSALPREVQLEWSLPDSLPLVRLARHALTQAVYNLVQNAGDATRGRPNGLVRVWAQAADDGQAVRLGVSDNGAGMTPQIKRRCLEPFFTTKTRGLSTGLGLSLMHGIVQRCGGSVEIETELDNGATFIMTLPACASADRDDQRRGRRPIAVVSLQDRRIGAFITALLRALRFDVRSAPAPAPATALWVLSGENSGLAQAEAFISADPQARALVLGAPDNGHEMSKQITVLAPDAPLTQIQQSLRSITAAIANAPAIDELPPAVIAALEHPKPGGLAEILQTVHDSRASQ